MAKTREMAKNYRKVLDETFGTSIEVVEDIEVTEEVDSQQKGSTESSTSLKKRAASAKSHIFRKGKIENK